MSEPIHESLVVRSPAKINLSLAVLGKRSDGYHELDTMLLAIDRFDRVEVRRAPREVGAEGEVRISLVGAAVTEDIPADASNLAVHVCVHRFFARRSAELATKPCIWILFDRPDNRVFQQVWTTGTVTLLRRVRPIPRSY